MKKTKPNCRGIRQICGLTRKQVAKDLDVVVSTVVGWESESRSAYSFSNKYWEYLQEKLRAHLAVVRSKVDLWEVSPNGLLLFESSARGNGKDEEEYYTQANASTLAAASILIEKGLEVDFEYPSN